MNKHAIGIDIGGTNTTIGLVSPDGTVVATTNLSTQEYSDSSKFMDDIVSGIRKLLGDHEGATVAGIGIGAPNANFSTGYIEANTANLRMKEPIAVCNILQDRFNIPAVASNDADAAAIGERIYGGAKECDNFVMVTLGTGVGSGFFVEGRLVHGANCMAGELGHLIVNPNGRDCSCGRKGCLETYTSARGICDTYRELVSKNAGTHDIAHLQQITCKDIGDLANKGDATAIETFRITARWLAIGLANAATFSNPEKIFLMGGPTRVGNPLLHPLNHYFSEQLLYIYKDRVSIELSQLNYNDAAILGAAALIHLK